MSSSNFIDLVSDDEDCTAKSILKKAHPEVQIGNNSEVTSASPNLAHGLARTQPSVATNEGRRCHSLEALTRPNKDDSTRKRCQSEPHSISPSMGASAVQTGMHASQAPASKQDTSPRQIRRTAFRACKDCRKQKMRCEGILDESCERCRRVGRPCVWEYGAESQRPTNTAPPATPSNPPNGKAALSLKRKPSDRPEIANKRPRQAPVAQRPADRPEIANKRPRTAAIAPKPAVVPNQPTAQPCATSTCNTVLWSTPAYQGPDGNAVFVTDQETKSAAMNSPFTTSNPIDPALMPSTTPAPTISSPSNAFNPTNPTIPTTNTPAPRTRQTRTRRTMWTCAQLASLASELQASFDFEGFATRNTKSKAQVLESFSYLVTKPMLEYSQEGQRIARKFHRDLKEDRERVEKGLKGWRRRENGKQKESHGQAVGTQKEKEKALGVGAGGKAEVMRTGAAQVALIGKTDEAQKEQGTLEVALGASANTDKTVEVTKNGPSENALAQEREGSQTEKVVLEPALAARVGEKAEVAGNGPSENAMAKQRKGSQATRSVLAAASGTGEGTEGVGEKVEVRARGPIETALVVEREKREQQMIGMSG